MSITPSTAPGIQFEEIDESTYVSLATGKVGATAAKLSWGATDTVMYVDNMQTVLDSCGYPTSENIHDYLILKSFLAYSNTLYLTRVVGGDAKNAYALLAGAEDPETDLLCGNGQQFEKFIFPEGVAIIGKYPGSVFNSYKISLYNYAGIAMRDCEKYSYGVTLQSDDVQVVSAGSSEVGATLTIKDTDFFDYKPRIGDWLILQDDSGVGLSKDKKWETSGVLSKITSMTYDADQSQYTVALDSQLTSTDAPTTAVIFHNGYVSNVQSPDYVYYQVTTPDGLTIFESFTSEAASLVADVNKKSSVIWMDNIGVREIQSKPVYEFVLKGGSAGEDITDADYISAFSIFKDKEAYTIDFLFSGMCGVTCQKTIVDEIIGTRNDCSCFITPPYSAVVDNKGNEVDAIIEWRSLIGNSNRTFIEGCWKQIYSEFDDEYYWIPTNADCAGLCTLRDPWVAIAGKNYGSIRNVIKLSWQPNETQYKILFPKGINAIKSISGSGIFLWGDHTATDTNSALDALSVVNTMNYIERKIVEYSTSILWENNTYATRQRFKLGVEQFLRTIIGAGGIDNAECICDESVNTASIINNKCFVAVIRIKPVLPIRNVLLSFVVTEQGYEFTEAVE
jgi:hypothetical protein